jgi:hypothetical protein
MSKAAHEVVAALRTRAKSVYELAAEIGRSEASARTIVFELRRSGYLENTVSSYPAKYKLTAKAEGPIVIEWKPRAPAPRSAHETMVRKTIRNSPNSVFDLARASA